MQILNMRVNSIKEAKALINDTAFTKAVGELLQRYITAVEEDNAHERQNYGVQLAEWEASKPDIDEKRAQVVGSDEHFAMAQWQKANPKPKVKQYPLYSVVAPAEVAADAKFLFANEGLIGLCFNTVELATILNELDDDAIVTRYQKRLEKQFPNLCKVMFPDLWEQYEREQAEVARAQREADLVAQQEQAQANRGLAAEAAAAAANTITIREAVNLAMANLAGLIDQLEDPRIADEHTLAPSDMPSMSRLMTAIYSANSAQVKTMQGVVGMIARGHISGCRPMTVGCITFFYDWLLSIRKDSNIKSKVFSDWFDGPEGMQMQAIICKKIGRNPPLVPIGQQSMMDFL